MSEIIAIEGGHKLNGTVEISGAKNATVALIPAIILADSPVTIYGVPEISDVDALAVLLEELNCTVLRSHDSLIVDPSRMENVPLVSDAVDKLRASYYLMGALLGKCKKVVMKAPGGCFLGPRPIDLHIKGFEALGAKVEFVDGAHVITADRLVGAKIYLDFASVGATINILLAAVKAEGKTVIENAAKEPEIIDVVNLLTKMGAKIRGAGTDTITIEGVEHLKGCKLTAVISKSNCIVIFINQLREKVGVMFGNPETTTGGRALKFYSSVRLDVRRTESLKQGGEIVGNHVRVKVVKNKIAPPFREAEFDIMFGQGISREGDVLDLAVNAGIVNKSGAWYAYEGDKIGQGRENAKTYIHENPAFFDMLEAKVRDFYFTQPEDEDAAVQEDSEKSEAEE